MVTIFNTDSVKIYGSHLDSAGIEPATATCKTAIFPN